MASVSWLLLRRQEEATMGLLEIGVVLACASAFGFYITDPQE